MNLPDPLLPKIGESLDEWAKRMPYAYLTAQKKSLSYVFCALGIQGKDPILEAIERELKERNDGTEAGQHTF